MAPPPRPDNQAVARLFDEAALLLDLLGQEPRRARTWSRIAHALRSQEEDVGRLLAEGRLGTVEGVGAVTVGHVRELFRTGRMAWLEDLRRRVPPGLLALVRLPRLGPGRVRDLWHGLGVTGVADLEHACRTNRLRDLPGFGPALQAEALAALARGEAWGERRLLDAGRRAAARTLDRLQRDGAALRLGVAGAVRRMAPTVEGVDLVATAHDADSLLEALARLPFVDALRGRGETWAQVRLEDGVLVRLDVAPAESAYPALLAWRTGSEAHVRALVERAEARGLRFAPDGLWREDERLPLQEEEQLYDRLDLPPHPPECREQGDLARPPSEDLVRMEDVKGLAHVHTVDGAGAYGLEEMVGRAEREGYRWVLVADRSRSAFPRGASREAVERQIEAVARLNADEDVGVEVLSGTEVDVLPDGSLDWPDDLLARFDVVIASVNDGHGPDGRPQDEAAMTGRILRAVAHPRVHVLAHPTGRILLGRTGWPVNVPAVLEACAAAGVVVGVSGLPYRLDLDEAWHADARRRGLLCLPTADAHDLDGVDQAILAVGCARRGGWRREEVLATWEASALRAWFRSRAPGDG